MNLSPTLRWLLGGLAAVVGFLAASDPFGMPSWAQGVIACLAVLFGALNLAPPQLGGTQQGLVNPSITEPPSADIHGDRGYGAVDVLLIVFLGLLCLIALLALLGRV